MPKLRAFGRKLDIGSDDLIIPAVLDFIATGAWATFTSTSFSMAGGWSSCLQVHAPVRTFYWGCMSFVVLKTGLLAVVVNRSLKGTLVNWWPRKTLSHFIVGKLVMDVAGLILLGLITKLLFNHTLNCDAGILTSMKSSTKAAWLVQLASLLFTAKLLFFSENHKTPKNIIFKTNIEEIDSVLSALRKVINDRWNIVKNCFGIHNHPGSDNISRLMTDYFEADIVDDLVPSDLMAATLLLQHRQQQQWRDLMTDVFCRDQDEGDGAVPSSSCVVTQPWMTTHIAAHFMKYAAGCYGWPMYVFSNPLAGVGLAKVLVRSRYIPRRLPKHVIADDAFMANTAVIRMTTGIPFDDLIFVSFQNKGTEIPFYVALDHDERAIVVAIRGTLSLDDVLTDLDAYASDEIPTSDVKDARAHQGMLSAAQVIKTKLLEGSVVPGSDNHGPPVLDMAWTKLKAQIGEVKARGYQLVITGHSLGAGVAGILAFLLKEEPRYKDLICFAFSPPGGLLSLSAAQHAESFICSVVLGDDIVPRLGLVNAYQLKLKLLQTIRDCDIPKHDIFGDWLERLMNHLFGVKTNHANSSRELQCSWQGCPHSEAAVRQFQKEVDVAIHGIQTKLRSCVPMYPPGCVMFVKPEVTKRSLFGVDINYKAVFTQCDSPLFDNILLTTDMISHHTPWAVLQALTWMKNWQVDAKLA